LSVSITKHEAPAAGDFAGRRARPRAPAAGCTRGCLGPLVDRPCFETSDPDPLGDAALQQVPRGHIVGIDHVTRAVVADRSRYAAAPVVEAPTKSHANAAHAR